MAGDVVVPSTYGDVVILAGGTGGAKLARGMLDVVGSERLAVIANTGDDIEIYGAHVSPDPDLITFWLADSIDERGWGLRDDTFNVMDGLRELGVDVWFNLGDRDLAWCLERTRMERSGLRPTEALRELCARIGLSARVLPMSDGMLHTFVNGEPLQEFLIRGGAQGAVHEVRFRSQGEEAPEPTPTPEPTPEVLAALQGARTVIVGPSNPVISVWPILSVLQATLESISVPVVAVSPIVDGQVLKGPTAACLAAMGQPASATGVVGFYESIAPGFLDGILTDESLHEGQLKGVRAECVDIRMDDANARTRVAERALVFAESLST